MFERKEEKGPVFMEKTSIIELAFVEKKLCVQQVSLFRFVRHT